MCVFVIFFYFFYSLKALAAPENNKTNSVPHINWDTENQ